MTGRKRHRDPAHSKLELATPLRGLKRSRSAFIKTRRSHGRSDYSKASTSKGWRRDVSQDSGHALNWLDSLIRKGRGILASLEEEEGLFKRELNEERQRIRRHKPLAEKEVDQRIHEISQIDECSFGRLEETLQDTIMDYNNKNKNQDYNQKETEEATNLGVENKDIVILSDEDEESWPVLHNSEEISNGRDFQGLIADEKELDLNGDRSRDQGLGYDTDGREKQEPKNSLGKVEEEALEESDGVEAENISPQCIVNAQDECLDKNSCYDAGFKSVHYTKNGNESEVNGTPVASDEIILIDIDERDQSSEGREPSEALEEEQESVYALESNEECEQGIEQEEESEVDIVKEDISDEKNTQKDQIRIEEVTEAPMDYQEIANQAIHQASRDSSQQGKPYQKSDFPRVSGRFQERREIKKRASESLAYNNPNFSVAENPPSKKIFRPHQPTKDANSSFSFLEDGNTTYFSTAEEDVVVESPVEEGESGYQSKETNKGSPRYKLLFCPSTYSTTSDDDNAQIVEPVSAYVSPFTDEALYINQIDQDPSGFLRRILESLGKSFDSELEDQIMEDANDFSLNPKKEFFCSRPDINTNEAKNTVKILSMSNRINADMYNIRLGTIFDENRGQVLNNQMIGTDQTPSLETSNNVDSLFFGPDEPDWVEEVESLQSTDDRGTLILEEVLPGSSCDGSVMVSSNPIIEFDSKPLNFANIILDEFTAPDLVEEPSDKDDIEDCILLEEIEAPEIEDTFHVASTDPIVEQPEPLLATDIELIELSESGNEEDVGNTISDSFNQISTFQVVTGERFIGRRLLMGNCDSENLWRGHQPSHRNGPYSSTSRILLSPIRALSRVISGVKDVGNALTDYIKAIGSAKPEMDDHIKWRLSNKDQGFKSQVQWKRDLGVDLFNRGKGEFSEDKKLTLEYPFKTNESCTDILRERTSMENASDNQELLSELVDIQKAIQKLENGSFLACKENVPIKNAVRKEVSDILVKSDDEPELDFNMEEEFLDTSESEVHRELHRRIFRREQMKKCDHEEKGFRTNEIKGRGENQGALNLRYIDHLPVDEEANEEAKRKYTIRGQSYVPVKTENLSEKVRGVEFCSDQGVGKGEDCLSPARRIEVEVDGDDLDLVHVHHHQGNKEKDDPRLHARKIKVQDEGEETLYLPPEIERKETASSPENRNGDSGSPSLDQKQRGKKKRKHSSSVNELDKRKDQRSAKGENRNSKKKNITRSKTAYTSVVSKRRKNNRSRKTR